MIGQLLSNRTKRITAIGFALLVAAALAFLLVAGFFDRDPERMFGTKADAPQTVGVLFSGDMGLRLGMGPHIGDALAKAGIPVLGLSSSTEFATHKTRAQVDALVAQSLRHALMRTGAHQAVLIGQSFGADILRVGLVSLPPDLRDRVVAAVLIVPGSDAYFRADPTGLAYRETPDAGPGEAARLNWLPVICIRGAQEPDSLCPLLHGPNIRALTLPGGHLLNKDHELLTRTILEQLQPILQARSIAS